jgi:hypothetical protein
MRVKECEDCDKNQFKNSEKAIPQNFSHEYDELGHDMS